MNEGGPHEERERSDELLADLAHDVAVLLRRDLELGAVQHAAQLRQTAAELVVAMAAAAALLLGLAAASWAAVLGLASALPSWAAALIVAGAWILAGLLLLRHDHPRRLVRRLEHAASGQTLASAQARLADARRAVAETAERLGEAAAREAEERELRAGITAAERLGVNAEQDAEDVLREVVTLLMVPGKAGISLLERLAGRRHDATP